MRANSAHLLGEDAVALCVDRFLDWLANCEWSRGMGTLGCLATVFAFFLVQVGAASVFQLGVKVVDPAGRPVSQAKVQLLDRTRKELKVTPENRSGSFLFGGLAAGLYRVEVSSAGFGASSTTLILRSNQSVTLRLAIAEQTTSITVSSPVNQLDPSAEASAGVLRLNRTELSNLPIEDDDVIAAMSRLVNPSGGGAATIVIDGMERTDSVTLTPSLVKEVRINNNGYSAQFPKPGKDRIEIDTASGGDTLHGAFAFRDRDSIFDARNPFSISKPSFSRQGFELNLNGPLVKKKLFFLVSANRDQQQQDIPVLAFFPSGIVRQDVVAPMTTNLFAGRLDWNVSEKQKASARYELHIDTADDIGVGGFGLPETGSTRFHHDYRVGLSDEYTFSPNVINQFQVALGKNYEQLNSTSNAPLIVVQGAFQQGGGQANEWREEPRYEFQDTLSATAGTMTWKVGAEARFHPITNFNADNFGGTYNFASLSAYTAGLPTLFAQNGGNPYLSFRQNEYSWFIQTEKRFSHVTLFAGLRDELQSGLASYPNLAPRVALAWSPGHDHKTVVRAGSGIFYDRRPPVILSQALRYNGINALQYLVTNPSFPVVEPLPIDANTVYQIDRTMTLPRIYQASATVDRELPGGFVATADYTYQRGNHLFMTRNINAPFSNEGVRPFSGDGNIDQVESAALSRGTVFTITVRSPPRKRYQLSAQYVLSYLRDNTSDVFTPPPPGSGIAPVIGPTNSLFSLPANNYDLRPEWGPSDNDIRHFFALQGTMQLPWHFNFGILTTVHSGLPYNITTGEDNNGDTDPNDRPPGVTRNTARGAGFASVDLHVGRPFVFRRGEHSFQCELGVDAFNSSNRTNLTGYVGVVTSPLYGQPSAAYGARQMQLSFKASF